MSNTDGGPYIMVSVAEARPGLPVVTACGEIDNSSCDLVVRRWTAAMAGQPNRLIVDFGAVTFFGSAGVTALLRLQHLCTERSVKLAVVALRPVQRVLDIVGLDKTFATFGSLDEAVSA
ncbi:anti-sigma-F factor antagonist RsfB [Amycolatopsis sp. NBRC 101858]|uniref:STAS domain-containing protein n=1 Tax=Amycolatopsis sp. NBRC 101858 TaxID=3032200 RepID=UPI0024A07B76|nr:STAS domain-containing protein [Amycolatopsis sp. NBRC 101858]GLY42786.1 anti-sigma-F factor antagonist RsfB [Amycolatopsis sp. NBRC 101858]